MGKKQKNLTRLWLRSLLRLTSSKIWDYLSLAIAAGVLLCLFLYISRDLLVTHLAGLSEVNELSLFFGTCLASLIQQRLHFVLRNNDDFRQFGYFISAPQKEQRSLRILRKAIWGYFVPILFWLFVWTFPGWTLWGAALGFLINHYIVTKIIDLFPKKKKISSVYSSFLKKCTSLLPGPLRWRILQIISHNRLTAALLVLAGVLQLSLVFFGRHSTALLWLIAFLGGLLAGFAHAIQAAQDMRSSWLEKNAGLSHGQFMGTQLQLTALIVSFQIILGLPFLIAGLTEIGDLASETAIVKNSLTYWSLILTGPSVTALVPGLILQIDGKKAEVSCMALFLLGLFIATGVLAHPAASVLTVLAVGYGLNSQTDRFYRQ